VVRSAAVETIIALNTTRRGRGRSPLGQRRRDDGRRSNFSLLPSKRPQNTSRDGKKPCRNSTSVRRWNSFSSLDLRRKHSSVHSLQKYPRSNPSLSVRNLNLPGIITKVEHLSWHSASCGLAWRSVFVRKIGHDQSAHQARARPPQLVIGDDGEPLAGPARHKSTGRYCATYSKSAVYFVAKFHETNRSFRAWQV
jgi:hypothetical protein